MRRTVKLWGSLTAATETLGKFGFRCVDVGLVCSTETEAETALACNISPRCSDAVGLQCPRIESFHAECGSSITGISSTRPFGSPENGIDFQSCPPSLPALPLITNDYRLQKCKYKEPRRGLVR